MPQNTPKLGIVLVAAVIATWVGGWGTPALAMNAFVAVTGLTHVSIEGDDGDIQAGVPFPTPRFSDKGDGTVKDNLTDLIWLKNANCFGCSTNGHDAIEHANALASGACGLTDGSKAGDWRLPNVKELQSLIDFGFLHPALSNAAGTGQCTATDCAFSGVQSSNYWSSTLPLFAPFAWVVDLTSGVSDAYRGQAPNPCIWPVRGGILKDHEP